MPKSVVCGIFVFTLQYERDGVYYYQITRDGKHWDYKHPFSSTEEMKEYAKNH